MFNFFCASIGWHLAQLVFSIACYELVRYLVLNRVKQFKNKKNF